MPAGSCPALSCPLLRGAPGHLVALGLGLCVALYVYFMYREMQRLDARVEVVCAQMASLHTSTKERLEEQQKQLLELTAAAGGGGCCPIGGGAGGGGGPFPFSMPLFFDPAALAAAGAGGGGMPVVVEEEGECGDGDGDGDGDDDSVDSQEIKDMLIAQVEDIEQVEDADAAAASTAVPEQQQQQQQQHDLRALKVDELRQMLRVRGLDWRGTKDVLVERLQQAAGAGEGEGAAGEGEGAPDAGAVAEEAAQA